MWHLKWYFSKQRSSTRRQLRLTWAEHLPHGLLFPCPRSPPPPQNEGRIRKKKRIILTLWMWIKLEIFWRNKFCEQLIFLRENTEKNQCVSTASSTSLWKCTYRNRKRKDCYKWKQTLKFVFHSREEMKYRNIL